MFRPAEDTAERLMAYAMQRNAVQSTAFMLHAQEQEEMMAAMQQQQQPMMMMPPDQMQGMAYGAPYSMGTPGQLTPEQQQQQMMMMQGMAGQGSGYFPPVPPFGNMPMPQQQQQPPL